MIRYAFCWLIVITRLLSRRIHLGEWKRLQLDDYLIVLAMCTDTVTMGVMHVVSTTSSNLIEPGLDVSTFSPDDIKHRVLGSKLVLVVEQMQCITIWLVKACLLLMYRRMTLVSSERPLGIRLICVQCPPTTIQDRPCCGRVCCNEFCGHGDPVLGSMVPPLSRILGCTD